MKHLIPNQKEEKKENILSRMMLIYNQTRIITIRDNLRKMKSLEGCKILKKQKHLRRHSKQYEVKYGSNTMLVGLLYC